MWPWARLKMARVRVHGTVWWHACQPHGDIGQFRIVAENGVSAGVRRIEAVAGKAAESLTATNEQRLLQLASMMKVSVADAPERLATLLEERKAMERQIANLQRQMATGSVAAAGVEKVGAARLATRNVGETPARELKGWQKPFSSRAKPMWWS